MSSKTFFENNGNTWKTWNLFSGYTPKRLYFFHFFPPKRLFLETKKILERNFRDKEKKRKNEEKRKTLL